MSEQSIIDWMKNSNNRACRFLAGNDFVQELAKNLKIEHVQVSPRKKSENSFQFVCDSRSKSETLIEIFGIPSERKELFRQKFKEAISGDGQEVRRINRLGSSSLLALLCFYSVSDKNRLNIKLNGQECSFYDVHFECRNHIDKDGDKCSNIDVLLLGRDSDENPIALFLESKFSECFARCQKLDGISNSYRDLYDRFQLEDGWEFLKYEKSDKSDNELQIASRDGKAHYCQGIKQMISHYRGLETICSSYNRQTQYGDAEHKIEGDIYLGTIVYDFGEDEYLKDYTHLYEELVDHFPKQNNITLVEELLTYNYIFGETGANNRFTLDNKIGQFYFPN